MVVIIVFKVINTCREFHVARKRIPLVHYSMTEEMTSLLTDVSRLGEIKSGYCHVVWSQSLPESCSVIVGEGLARLCNLKKQVEDGLRPMYRTAEWQQHERIIGKKLKRKSWYGANVESVVFCQATPNEILRKSLQEEVKKSGLNIRVVEKGGINVKSLLQRSDVKPEKSCNDPSCVVC